MMNYPSNIELLGSQTESGYSSIEGRCKKIPKNILLIKRLDSLHATSAAQRIGRILKSRFNAEVFVERKSVLEISENEREEYREWETSTAIDLIVAIGGDGTLLWVSQLFPHSSPPVVGVSMGNLGYLNQFKIDEVEDILYCIFYSTFSISFRQRLQVQIIDECNQLVNSISAFNECVIDRGRSSFLTTLAVYYNNHYFTDVSADGLILATPSGSTAYSMSAGGPVVHPMVPCFLFTPICPHSLSFRPLIIPQCAEIRIELSNTSKSASLAVDGRSYTEISKGMHVNVKASPHVFPIITRHDKHQLDAWLNSLNHRLNWNQKFRSVDYCVNDSMLEVEASNCCQPTRTPNRLYEEEKEGDRQIDGSFVVRNNTCGGCTHRDTTEGDVMNGVENSLDALKN